MYSPSTERMRTSARSNLVFRQHSRMGKMYKRYLAPEVDQALHVSRQAASNLSEEVFVSPASGRMMPWMAVAPAGIGMFAGFKRRVFDLVGAVEEDSLGRGSSRRFGLESEPSCPSSPNQGRRADAPSGCSPTWCRTSGGSSASGFG